MQNIFVQKAFFISLYSGRSITGEDFMFVNVTISKIVATNRHPAQ